MSKDNNGSEERAYKGQGLTKSSAVKVGKPLYKQCAGRAYLSKCKPGQNFAEINFGKASKGKIKLYLAWGNSMATCGAVNMTEVDGKKIYVIDDVTHVTMLLAEEY